VLVLAGVEQVSAEPGITAVNSLRFDSYPWSHGLVTAGLWALAAGALLWLRGRSTRQGAVVAAAVFSHWLLDFATHRPDLPLWFGSGTRFGLGLWNSVAATLVIESLLFAAGLGLYVRSTRPGDRVGVWALWSLVAALLGIYLARAFGPQPPAGTPGVAIAAPALAMWLFVAWAWWADRHRRAVAG